MSTEGLLCTRCGGPPREDLAVGALCTGCRRWFRSYSAVPGPGLGGPSRLSSPTSFPTYAAARVEADRLGGGVGWDWSDPPEQA